MVTFCGLFLFFGIFYFGSLFESINAFQLNTKVKNRFLSMNIDKNSLDEVVNLMKKNNEHSPYGLLSTINFNKNIEGYPFVSLAGFVVSDTGFPVFCFSKMSKHTKNLNKIDSDGFSKASLYIRESNVPWDKKNAMHSKRLTFTGNINKINYEGFSAGDEYWEEYNEYYKNLYKKVHPEAFWVDFPDFEMYKMDFIKDIYYIGGFSKANKINVSKYLKEFNLDVS